MPFDYGLRLDNRQRIANARAKPIEANKNQSVDGAEGLFLRSGSPQNVYLLPQHPNFYLKRRPRPDQIDDHPNNEPDKISHYATASPDSRSTASQIGFVTGTAWQIARVRVFIDENLHPEYVHIQKTKQIAHHDVYGRSAGKMRARVVIRHSVRASRQRRFRPIAEVVGFKAERHKPSYRSVTSLDARRLLTFN